MKKSLTLFLALSFLLIPRFAMAWSAPGHFLIAAEAYRELSPELKAQVFDTLKAHPDFVKWEKAYHPNPNFDLAAYVFMRSSTWPDEIRRSGSLYDHPNWHFIDYPLKPPDFPFEPGPTPTDDVLFGLAQCEKTLSDTNASPELRAVYLSWLIHLVGDIHQPLHCVSLFTVDYLNGDREAVMTFMSSPLKVEYGCMAFGICCWGRPSTREHNGIMPLSLRQNSPERPCRN